LFAPASGLSPGQANRKFIPFIFNPKKEFYKMKKIFSVRHDNRKIDFALLLTRVGIALLMLTHGVPKMGGLAKDPVQFMDFLGLGPAISLGLALFAEVICSVLLLLGLGTRLAVIPLSITMIVAAFHVHIGDPFAKQEMALHFLLVYVMLFILGSGKYSIDNLLFKAKAKF
jgi:putative oxidoreductase